MSHLTKIQEKIFESKEILSQKVKEWKKNNRKIVFTNGCFDLLHRGHVEYLSQAADLGEILIVGLNTDNSVKKLKGETRPLQDEYTRALILCALAFVSAVILFDEETPFSLISEILPDVLVKGGDYSAENVVGADVVTQNGGKVEIIPFVSGFSTTNLVQKMTNPLSESTQKPNN